jgi:hypothetical protein
MGCADHLPGGRLLTEQPDESGGKREFCVEKGDLDGIGQGVAISSLLVREHLPDHPPITEVNVNDVRH